MRGGGREKRQRERSARRLIGGHGQRDGRKKAEGRTGGKKRMSGGGDSIRCRERDSVVEKRWDTRGPSPDLSEMRGSHTEQGTLRGD